MWPAWPARTTSLQVHCTVTSVDRRRRHTRTRTRTLLSAPPLTGTISSSSPTVGGDFVFLCMMGTMRDLKPRCPRAAAYLGRPLATRGAPVKAPRPAAVHSHCWQRPHRIVPVHRRGVHPSGSSEALGLRVPFEKHSALRLALWVACSASLVSCCSYTMCIQCCPPHVPQTYVLVPHDEASESEEQCRTRSITCQCGWMKASYAPFFALPGGALRLDLPGNH